MAHPGARMKGDEDRKLEVQGDHLVPLSTQPVAILRVLKPLIGDLALLFPREPHLHKPISENTMRQLLVRAGYYQRHVSHVFRAAFSAIMNERLKANCSILDLNSLNFQKRVTISPLIKGCTRRS